MIKKSYINAILYTFALSFALSGCTPKAADPTAEAPESSAAVQTEAAAPESGGSVQTETTATEPAAPSAEAEAPKSSMTAPTLYSKTLGLDWNYTAYLPKSYHDEESADRTYPVIYLLHGAYGNHRNLVERFPIQEQLDEAVDSDQLQESIVVFVDGFNSFYVDGPALKMETAIVEDLIPQIESIYRVDGSRENRSIGGISMGGYGAARLALKHPELFSKAALISPAVWAAVDENTVTYDWHVFRNEAGEFDNALWEANHPGSFIESYGAQDDNVDFFVITGLADQVVKSEAVDQFVEQLKAVADVEYVQDEEGIHAWTFWAQAMPKALEFIGKE